LRSSQLSSVQLSSRTPEGFFMKLDIRRH
jgi:hypothetical protein